MRYDLENKSKVLHGEESLLDDTAIAALLFLLMMTVI